jgi:hypothetical protein
MGLDKAIKKPCSPDHQKEKGLLVVHSPPVHWQRKKPRLAFNFVIFQAPRRMGENFQKHNLLCDRSAAVLANKMPRAPSHQSSWTVASAKPTKLGAENPGSDLTTWIYNL